MQLGFLYIVDAVGALCVSGGVQIDKLITKYDIGLQCRQSSNKAVLECVGRLAPSHELLATGLLSSWAVSGAVCASPSSFELLAFSGGTSPESSVVDGTSSSSSSASKNGAPG